MQVFMNKEIPSIEDILSSLETVPTLDEAEAIIDNCNWANLGHWEITKTEPTEDEYGYYEAVVQYIAGETGELTEKSVKLPFNIKY